MSIKEDIMNAWITIEKLSEGEINIKENDNKKINLASDDWYTYFLKIIETEIKQKNNTNKPLKNSGITMYFDIFDFEEIVSFLRNKYNIEATSEDINSTKKFTFSISFDNKLNFLEKKVFYTISGYIKQKGEIPTEFHKIESDLRTDLKNLFEKKSFNEAITSLFEKHNVSEENFRYKFVKDFKIDDVKLHSFFINDLDKAKKVKSENLFRYLTGFTEHRYNLDSKSDSKNFNKEIFEEILQPKNFPLGRFPSNSSYALSFMQQVAVNLAINDSNTIQSVNGPPGTGKTTLLKDIFAELVVQQAKLICDMNDKVIEFTLSDFDQGKLGVLPKNIADKGIIVASSNNGAVKNIVDELPKLSEKDTEFNEKLIEADYFRYLKNEEDEKDKKDESVWGTFSLEGGSSNNVSNLISSIRLIEENLEKKYIPNSDVYTEFETLYNKLNNERQKVQVYYEKMIELERIKNIYNKINNDYIIEKNRKSQILKLLEEETKNTINNLQKEKEVINGILSNTTNLLKSLDENQIQVERNFDVIKSQQPSLIWICRIINKKNINDYFEKLNKANELLNSLLTEKKQLLQTQIVMLII